MTFEDAVKLNPGGVVHWRANGRVFAGKVVRVRVFSRVAVVCVDVRPFGLTPAGRRRPVVCKYNSEIRRSDLPPAPAHVFADFLDENGEPRAAEKLRAAFPMGEVT